YVRFLEIAVEDDSSVKAAHIVTLSSQSFRRTLTAPRIAGTKTNTITQSPEPSSGFKDDALVGAGDQCILRHGRSPLWLPVQYE
ncbi:hypothetical protein ACC687_38005, partial [Rhizobium ruizarguesonis]